VTPALLSLKGPRCVLICWYIWGDLLVRDFVPVDGLA